MGEMTERGKDDKNVGDREMHYLAWRVCKLGNRIRLLSRNKYGGEIGTGGFYFGVVYVRHACDCMCVCLARTR